MQAKKNSKQDVHQGRPLFMSIGLILSLMLVISAFEWKFHDNLEKVDLGELEGEDIELITIPQIIEPKPQPPVVKSPEIVVVQDDEKVDEEIKAVFEVKQVDPSPKISLPPLEVPIVQEEAKEEEPIVFSEVMPSPKGGMSSFYKYLRKSLDYPKLARRIGVEGSVFVQFVVEKDGSFSDFKVLKGIGSGCDEEALRVLSEAPDWNPGKQRGRAVRVRMTIPIRFKLH